MKSAIDNWYDRNLENWKYHSKEVISKANITKYMDMYKEKCSIDDNGMVLINQDPKFVYNNDQYKNTKVEKFAKCSPPTSKSPIRQEFKHAEVSSMNENTSESFFKTQTGLIEPQKISKPNPATVSNTAMSPSVLKVGPKKASRRGTSLNFNKVIPTIPTISKIPFFLQNSNLNPIKLSNNSYLFSKTYFYPKP